MRLALHLSLRLAERNEYAGCTADGANKLQFSRLMSTNSQVHLNCKSHSDKIYAYKCEAVSKIEIFYELYKQKSCQGGIQSGKFKITLVASDTTINIYINTRVLCNLRILLFQKKVVNYAIDLLKLFRQIISCNYHN